MGGASLTVWITVPRETRGKRVVRRVGDYLAAVLPAPLAGATAAATTGKR